MTHRKAPVYRDTCFRCGGPVWDNRQDVQQGKKTPIWRCKEDRGPCKDGGGYTTSEWSPDNPDKGGPAQPQAQPQQRPPDGDMYGRDFRTETLDGEPDELPFASEADIDVWTQCLDVALKATAKAADMNGLPVEHFSSEDVRAIAITTWIKRR